MRFVKRRSMSLNIAEHIGRMVNIGGKTKTPKRVAIVLVVCLLLAVLVHWAAYKHDDRVYGMMIDAGSTGSRIHTFVFRKDGEGNLILDGEDFFKTSPGLSAFKDSPAEAGLSLRPLIERAQKVIPTYKQSKSPIFLRATAGLRLIGHQEAEAILSEVRSNLRSSPFRFDSDEWVSVLDGDDEGIYSWITVNYLLGRNAANTVGTLEMGGGSAQVAFATKFSPSNDQCAVNTSLIQYKGENLALYVVSHLSYGLRMAREKILRGFQAKGATQENPCFNTGPFEITHDPGFRGTGRGNFEECVKLLNPILDQAPNSCGCDVCTYAGRPQPPPPHEFVAFAFYFERTIAVGLESPITLASLGRKGQEICALNKAEVERRFKTVPNGEAKDLCLDIAFMYGHLQRGHGLTQNEQSSIMVVDKIKGVELGWSLGAMFAEMSKLRDS
mmetsp:Transcript_11595/g.23576  ORF Transcript_11595/g.23576 Transcript_11595/m.23576 type:complete len:442 (-) Transcript_11595:1531-2856(-)